MKSLALGALIALLGTALGWTLAAPRHGAAPGRPAVPQTGVAGGLDELRELVGSLRAELALRAAPGPAKPSARDGEMRATRPAEGREPVDSAPAAADPGLADLARQVESLERAVASLRDSLVKGTIPARFPPHELVRRSAPVADWSRLQPFADDSLGRNAPVSEALQQTVRWKSQEEILTTFGRPTTIDAKGSWNYKAPADAARLCTVVIYFVEDYAMGIAVLPSW